jgi:hypothetical protein
MAWGGIPAGGGIGARTSGGIGGAGGANPGLIAPPPTPRLRALIAAAFWIVGVQIGDRGTGGMRARDTALSKR